jgi:hypothetical protein
MIDLLIILDLGGQIKNKNNLKDHNKNNNKNR